MRIAVIAALFVIFAAPAKAQYSAAELNYYCGMGSQTPISIRSYCRGYGGPIYRERSYGYYGGRRLSWREVQYYCSLGDQTPISLRHTCIRAGLW